MIEARELRIGNYVYDSTDHCRIDIQCSDFCYSGNFESIPLTEEWLIKLEFTSNPYDDTYLIGFGLDGLLTIHCDKTKGKLILWEDRTSVILKSVHQLQNLYYALTNEELTIKN